MFVKRQNGGNEIKKNVAIPLPVNKEVYFFCVIFKRKWQKKGSCLKTYDPVY